MLLCENPMSMAQLSTVLMVPSALTGPADLRAALTPHFSGFRTEVGGPCFRGRHERWLADPTQDAQLEFGSWALGALLAVCGWPFIHLDSGNDLPHRNSMPRIAEQLLLQSYDRSGEERDAYCHLTFL